MLWCEAFSSQRTHPGVAAPGVSEVQVSFQCEIIKNKDALKTREAVRIVCCFNWKLNFIMRGKLNVPVKSNICLSPRNKWKFVSAINKKAGDTIKHIPYTTELY